LDSLAALDGLRNPVLLPNPLPQRSELGVDRAEVSPEGFIAVARLVHQKGLDVLIDALAIAGGVAQGWTLTVVGEGPEREALMAQVMRLQLGDRVRFSDTVLT
jgi:glycosyltransferase involved in cell wall biosynthesis